MTPAGRTIEKTPYAYTVRSGNAVVLAHFRRNKPGAKRRALRMVREGTK